MDSHAAWQLLILLSLAPILRRPKDWVWSPIAAQTASAAPARRDPAGAPDHGTPDHGPHDHGIEAFEAQFAAQRAALRAHMAMADAGARLQAEREGPELRLMMDRLKAEWFRGSFAAQGTLLPPGPETLIWPADRALARDWLETHLESLTEARARLDRDHALMTGLLKICGTGFLVWLEQETNRTRGFLGLSRPAPAIRVIQRRIQIAPNPILSRPPSRAALPTTSLGRTVALRKIVTARVIPHLILPTEARNLPRLLQEGLPPGTAAALTFPNDQAFARARLCQPDSDWVVLILSRHILWNEDCLFAQPGHEPDPSPEALEALLSSPNRPSHLRPCDPCDLRAQVLVRSRIAPDLIEALAFETPEAMDRHLAALGQREAFACGKTQGFFGPAPRHDAGQS